MVSPPKSLECQRLILLKLGLDICELGLDICEPGLDIFESIVDLLELKGYLTCEVPDLTCEVLLNIEEEPIKTLRNRSHRDVFERAET